MTKFSTQNAKQTKKLAALLAKEILAAKPAGKNAFIVALIGDLGSGKTTFTQGFAEGLGVKEKITSPTFVLMHRHKIKIRRSKSVFKNFYHFDCYRFAKPEEISVLGFKEIAANPENIVLLEWADKIKKILPENALVVKFKYRGKNAREISALNN